MVSETIKLDEAQRIAQVQARERRALEQERSSERRATTFPRRSLPLPLILSSASP